VVPVVAISVRRRTRPELLKIKKEAEMSLVESLQRKDGAELMKEIIDAQCIMFEDKLREVLDRHSLKLGEDGVECLSKILRTDTPEISIVYELRKNNVMVETFGFTLDLTSPL
jgi:hypothetical protein